MPVKTTKVNNYSDGHLVKSIVLVRCDIQTDLSSSQNVVPDGSASKVNVEICEAALHTHETVPERYEGRIENHQTRLKCEQKLPYRLASLHLH